MALRQGIADVPLGIGLFVEEKKKIIRVRPPVPASFRHADDMKELLAIVRGHDSVAVDAAVGAGKSTRLPSQLARELGMLVVQVVPSDYLAADIGGYVAELGYECVAKLDPLAEWPKSGVVVVSASGLVAHWLAAGRMDMPECVLMHDESHESDAYTYIVRRMWSVVPGVVKYITATATGGVSGYRRQETGAEVIAHEYEPIPSEDWDLDGEDGHPWEAGAISDNILIFEDSKKNAERLQMAYADRDFVVFRLHSRMKLSQFQGAMTMARMKKSLVVLIADSTFRSGFTMPVSTVIDTGVVINTVVDGGNAVRFQRDAYAFERYQAAGRVGRVPGTKSHVWAPRTKPEAKMVVLEDADADAAALLMRAFGWAPARELLDTRMSEGPVPRDLVSALQGFAPLALLDSKLMVDVVQMATPEGRRSPMVKPGVVLANADTLDFENHIVSAHVARKYQKSPDGRWELKSRPDSGYAETIVSSEGSGDVGDVIRGLIESTIGDEDFELAEGDYCCAPAMPGGTKPFCAIFPDGYSSVLRFMVADESRAMHSGLPVEARWSALSALLGRLNVVSCELNAALMAARDIANLSKGRDAVAVRVWATSFVSRIGELQAESRVLIDCASRLAVRFCQLQKLPADIMSDQEKSFADFMVNDLRAMPVLVPMIQNVQADVRKKLVADMGYSLPEVRGRARLAYHRQDDALLDKVTMPRVGRGMRAFDPGKGSSGSNRMRLGRWVSTS